MKLCISGIGAKLDGYESVSLYPNKGAPMMIAQLSNKVEDEQAVEIIAEHILEYIAYKDYPIILEFLAKKTRKDGKLVVSVINAKKIANYISNNQFDNIKVNQSLFGDTITVKSAVIDKFELIELFNSYGLEVLQVRSEDFRDILVCQKK